MVRSINLQNVGEERVGSLNLASVLWYDHETWPELADCFLAAFDWFGGGEYLKVTIVGTGPLYGHIRYRRFTRL